MYKNKKKFQKIKLLILDFDGVMTDNRVLVQENGKEAVFCNRGDGLAIEMLRKAGLEILVISKERNKVVEARCKKLKIRCLSNIDNKYKSFLKEIKKRNLKSENVCFIGNDINDLEVMKIVGFPMAPADAAKEIKDIARVVTEAKGGEGVIRELLNILNRDLK